MSDPDLSEVVRLDEVDGLTECSVYADARDERKRAHAKHGDTSMEAFPVDDMNRLAILTEEIGEVAKEFNEARHRGGLVDVLALRKELIQVAAMALAWADAIDRVEP